MANPEHLKILKKGAAAWNKWRKENPDIEPDLTRADLYLAYLRGANLHGVYLSEANLNGADLSKANLSWAKLYMSNLSEANLSGADLQRADLLDADLSGANLHKAKLKGARLNGTQLSKANLSEATLNGTLLNGTQLSEANLRGANFSEVDLRGAKLDKVDLSKAKLDGTCLHGVNLSGANLFQIDLTGADLGKANLRGVNLTKAKLYMSNLSRANLSEACFIKAELYKAKLKKANLKDAELRWCDLTQTDLTGGTLTGTKLYGTARDDWIIKDIECEYIYWDLEGKQRSPKDRDLAPGEFERLYAALPTIEYVFERGMTPIDPLIMDRVVQAIRERQPEFDIKIDSINARGLAPSIKFTVQHEEHKEPALAEVGKEYQIKQAQLEGKLEEISKHIKNLIDRPNTINIINAPQAKYLAIDGSTLNVEETSNYYAYELQKVIEQEPEKSENFAKVAKKTALDIIGDAIKDIAKGQVKEAAKEIIKLGKDLGPIIVKTAAYGFFKSML